MPEPKIGTYQEQPMAAIDKAEEEDKASYTPPYEDHQGELHENDPEDVQNEIEQEEPQGQVHDARDDQSERKPDVPTIPHSDDPTGGVDRRGQSGEQGDDDLKGFHDQGA
jgi:hypothetical protein